MRLPAFFYVEKTLRYPCIIKTRRNRYNFGFFYSLRLARRLAETGLSTNLPPVPYAATLLPSREPGRLAGKPSAPALPPGSPYYRHKGWGRGSGEGNQLPPTAYGRPPHRSCGGHRAPQSLPFAFGFSGGFCRTQPAPSAAGDSTPQDGGTGAERSFPLTTPRAGRVPEGKPGGGLVLSSQLSHKFLPSPDSCALAALLSARKNLPHTEASSSSPARTGGAASPDRAFP